MVDHVGTLKFEYDGISMKTKPSLTRFGGILGTLRFIEKRFFITLSEFTPYWDYKPTNAIRAKSPGVNTSDRVLNLSKLDKINLKCDVIDGSVVNGIRQPKIFTLTGDKPPVYKVFCEPEAIHYKKINKTVLNTITFYKEDNNHQEVEFNQKDLTFTLQLIKI